MRNLIVLFKWVDIADLLIACLIFNSGWKQLDIKKFSKNLENNKSDIMRLENNSEAFILKDVFSESNLKTNLFERW